MSFSCSFFHDFIPNKNDLTINFLRIYLVTKIRKITTFHDFTRMIPKVDKFQDPAGHSLTLT